ncbi:MAG: hypothetical protein JST89_08745 [Cyanobacteria bacterium SZAS-4]|nr:hypothetical protein [Cyanobacteria bacterium SZAS-4]
MRILLLSLILFTSWVGFDFGRSYISSTPCQAQSPLLGDEELIRQLNLAAGAMRTYRKTHANFPQLQPDLDDALKSMFKAVSFTPANTEIVPQGRGIYRTYYQFAIAVDPSIRSLPIINGQYKPPNTWNAPPRTIVVYSDGQNQFAAWVAGSDGKPIDDPTTHVPLIIYETIDPEAASNPQ